MKKIMIKGKSTICLIVSLGILAVFSFAPCIKVSKTVNAVAPGEAVIRYDSYLPLLFCMISAIEIMLLIFGKHKWLRGVGICLHLIKMIIPIKLYCFMDNFLPEGIMGVSTTSSLSLIGRILMVAGAVIIGLYLWDLLNIGGSKSGQIEV